MGLLDDAIREHLELKRRHGADPGEVARIEDEALSPAKREAPAAAASVAESPVELDDPLADPHPRDAEPDRPAAAEDLEAPVAHHEPEPEPEAVYEVGPDALEPEPEAAPQPPAEPGEEDVLEETPEFLQETPEHDRLWFEQKPPKDFDF